jgi:hypothetical protein
VTPALTKCPGMYVDVSVDRFSRTKLQHILPALSHNGETVTIRQLRQLCREHRAKGFHVFPKDGCDNYDAHGFCQGHPPEAASA